MSLRRLRIPALLLFVFPVFAHAQSLGDVARKVRAERQHSGAPQLKVYTNDDLISPASQLGETPSLKEGNESAPPESSAEGANKPAGSEAAGSNSGTSPAKEREKQEKEIEKRTQEINQQYLDKIAALRAKIGEAQQLLARLQREQVESTNQYRASVGTNPSIPQYEQQQRMFQEQIEAQQNLITGLNSQLEDAQESARHAGVPHATDY